MARKKTIEAIETEISKVKSDMSKLQDLCLRALLHRLPQSL